MPKLMYAPYYIHCSWVFSGHLLVVYSLFLVLWCFLILNREHGTCWNGQIILLSLSVMLNTVAQQCSFFVIVSTISEWKLYYFPCGMTARHCLQTFTNETDIQFCEGKAYTWCHDFVIQLFIHSFMHASFHSALLLIHVLTPSHSLQPVLIDHIVLSLITPQYIYQFYN